MQSPAMASGLPCQQMLSSFRALISRGPKGWHAGGVLQHTTKLSADLSSLVAPIMIASARETQAYILREQISSADCDVTCTVNELLRDGLPVGREGLEQGLDVAGPHKVHSSAVQLRRESQTCEANLGVRI